ncbi:PHP domain-containing protein [Nitrospirillum bahiense]|uniref:PHP domain-containing protein n=1 Tax=Nitrospirillum amazonense TaxID=28077 RepID=A0A560FVE8_9PROT|nr:PHP domain-containing protein [Nitrospirillum amazonense]TWB25623.1 PHP domain-containing protein [Nitrospirillum amazonense]
MTFAEPQVTTNYSFLRSGSDPGEFALAAAALGYQAIGIADRATLAGVVRMHVACRSARIRLVVGTRLDLTDAPPVLVYPMDRAAYGRLSRLLTLGKRRATKGNCALSLADLADHGEGQVVVSLAPEGRPTTTKMDRFRSELIRLKERFADRTYLAVSPLYRGYDRARLMRLGDLADGLGVPLMATNDALYHHPGRHVLHDVVTCIRLGCTLADAGKRLLPHGERYLKAPEDMARLFAARPDAVAGAAEIATRCTFSLDELRYEYPAEPVPAGSTPQRELVRRTWAGAAERYPQGVPAKVVSTIEHEFDLVAKLNYAPYFLTVHDIVLFARGRGILCQGRGSAANSAICYCLGITSVDPTKHDLLFERFVSAARDEPPDIDVDFEHERREEVIQYIYARYGRERAGLAATVITYRSKLAIREVGKVLGLTPDTIGALAKATWGRGNGLGGETAQVAGLDGTDPTLALAIDLAQDLRGFPRHLSQHVGGFVITRGRLDEMVPVENAAMEDRTVIEWDKDDLDALGLLKIDILALGMLSCLRKGFELLSHRLGRLSAWLTCRRRTRAPTT